MFYPNKYLRTRASVQKLLGAQEYAQIFNINENIYISLSRLKLFYYTATEMFIK